LTKIILRIFKPAFSSLRDNGETIGRANGYTRDRRSPVGNKENMAFSKTSNLLRPAGPGCFRMIAIAAEKPAAL
jgi:hypothetical protein